jgi:hypothetical protein
MHVHTAACSPSGKSTSRSRARAGDKRANAAPASQQIKPAAPAAPALHDAEQAVSSRLLQQR